MARFFHLNKYILACLTVAFVVTSCKQPETIVIESDPLSNANDEIIAKDTASSKKSADFMQLNIGELNSVTSLDPLYAQNTGTMRALQLAYEGLVRYNENETIIPGIAKSWSVSQDSLTYTFTLRSNVYYHDNDTFSSGVGRKLIAADIRYVFERMAAITVPRTAAKQFMNIYGFEPFFQEQHYVFNPKERRLETIAGISTPNETTVSFRLVKKDAHFLQKLASPFALIYPREAVVSENPYSFKPIGTGPFQLSQTKDDVLTFSKFKNYYQANQPKLSRVDIITTKKEASLFQNFAKRDVDLIPEMGPQMLEGVMSNSGSPKQTYANTYKIYSGNSRLHYLLKYNPNSDYARPAAFALTQVIDSSFTIYPSADLIAITKYQTDSTASAVADTTTISFTEDPFASWLSGKLNRKLVDQGLVFQMLNIRTPTRNTGLYFAQHIRYYPSQNQVADKNALVDFSISHYGISQNKAKNILMNRYPWWLDLRTTTISGSNQ